jgi:hypothetical protein
VLGAVVVLTVLIGRAGHIGGALGLVLLSVMPLIFFFDRATAHGTPACPACEAYLSFFFVQRRCPRCDFVLE